MQQYKINFCFIISIPCFRTSQTSFGKIEEKASQISPTIMPYNLRKLMIISYIVNMQYHSLCDNAQVASSGHSFVIFGSSKCIPDDWGVYKTEEDIYKGVEIINTLIPTSYNVEIIFCEHFNTNKLSQFRRTYINLNLDLRWLKTVSSTFQDVDFDVSL